MFIAEAGSSLFCYPFLISEIPNSYCTVDEPLYDISSVYGYSGALIKNNNTKFFHYAWKKFDEWANLNRVICEFTRFSFYHQNEGYAHPNTIVDTNRINAVNYFHITEAEHKLSIGSKTRNMIKKALTEGFAVKEVEFKQYYNNFKCIYDELMQLNTAEKFFYYDDKYYRELSEMSDHRLKLFGLFNGDMFVGGAMIILYKQYALYHLGAVSRSVNCGGCSNLYLFEIWKCLKQNHIQIFNLGGGRSVDEQDPLLKFKLSNSNSSKEFKIGTRIIDSELYEGVKKKFIEHQGKLQTKGKLQFYRHLE